MAEPDPRWAAVAADLTWDTRPTGLYTPEGPYGRWFPGGTLNAAVNCLDRHVEPDDVRWVASLEHRP